MRLCVKSNGLELVVVSAGANTCVLGALSGL